MLMSMTYRMNEIQRISDVISNYLRYLTSTELKASDLAHHRQRKVRGIEVDAGIASLLRMLWDLNIETVNSCEGDPDGRVWIEFASPDDAGRFMHTVTRFEPGVPLDGLYNRMFCISDEGSGYWSFSVDVGDLAHDIPFEPEHDKDDPIIKLWVSVRFPKADLHEIEKRVRRALRQKIVTKPKTRRRKGES